MTDIRNEELFDVRGGLCFDLFAKASSPCEVIRQIKAYIEGLLKNIPDGYTEIKKGVIAGENVKIHPSAVIEAPAVIGRDTEIRPNAYIRGSVIIGEGCVIGNSTELKNALLLDHVQVPHYNYVGDSILGNYAHLGAGVICSNLKSDKSNVTITINGEKLDTGMRKLGAVIGDCVDVGCNCVLNPGTVIGKNTAVYPLTALRGVYPENSIVKSQLEIVKKNVL